MTTPDFSAPKRLSVALADASEEMIGLLVRMSGELRRRETGELEVVAELRGRPVSLVFTMSLRCATVEEAAAMEAPPPEARS